MPYTDGKHSLAKLQVSISEIKQYFHHDIYMGGSLLLWLAAAVVWVDWRSRAAAGVCITATVTGKLWYRRRSSTCSPACVGEAHGRAGEHHGLVRGVPGGARAKPR